MESPESSYISSPDATPQRSESNKALDSGEVENPTTYIKFLVSNAAAGSVIGRGGSTINDFQSQSGARIQLSRNHEFFPGTSDRIIMISGKADEVLKATDLILHKLLSEIHSEDGIDADLRSKVRLVVPNSCCGAIIGKGGATIKSFIEDSQAGIKISPQDNGYLGLSDRLVTLTGSFVEQMRAIDLILSKLTEDHRYLQSMNAPFSYPVGTSAYNAVSYGPNGVGAEIENSEEDRSYSITIGVADEHIGVVVGRGGRSIMEISQISGARIKISDRGDFLSGTSQRKVAITGSERAIQTAEAMILQKVASVSGSQIQAPVTVQAAVPKNNPDCYGVFCLTYDLKAEEETKYWKKMVTVAVSGAAGMIANHLLFKLASGEVFGLDQPIALKLLGSERSFQALEGVAMELEDSLYPLLREVSISIDPYEVFQDAEWALLIGAKPRGPGMERADLLDINGKIFSEQGKALNAVASRNVKVIVVGNPCNTNALICLKNAPNIPARNFHALMRLDENRAKCQLALKAGVFYDNVSNMTIWGNHSTTQVPDFLNVRINGFPVKKVIKDHKWLEKEFTQKVQKRGGILIQKWGRSSGASTAVSIVDAMRSLITPTNDGDWFSSGVYTNGNPYGISEDLVFSMPCRSKGDGDYELVKDVIFDDYVRSRISKTEAELLAERRCIAHLIGEGVPVCNLPTDTMLPGEM